MKKNLQRFLSTSYFRQWGVYVFIFTIPRVILSATLRDLGFWRVELYAEYAKLMGIHGVWSVWTYSSFFNYVIYGLWEFSELLLPTNPMVCFWTSWTILLFVADLFTSILIYKIVKLLSSQHVCDPKRAWQTTLLYAFLPTSLMFYADFNVEPLVVALTMTTLYCLMRARSIKSSVAAAIGGSLKIFSWLIFPTVIISDISNREKVKWLFSFITTSLLIHLPHLIINHSIALSPYKWQAGRTPWETVHALILWFIKYPLPENSGNLFWKDSGIFDNWSYYQCGITPGTSLNVLPVPSYIQWWSVLSSSLMLITVAMLIFSKRTHTSKDMALSLLFSTSIFLIISFGWSGNFLAHLAPLLLIYVCISGAWHDITLYFVLWLSIFLEYPHLYFGGLEAAQCIANGLPPPMPSLLFMIGYWLIILVRTTILIVVSIISWKALRTRKNKNR